jgi:hypothetical protein
MSNVAIACLGPTKTPATSSGAAAQRRSGATPFIRDHPVLARFTPRDLVDDKLPQRPALRPHAHLQDVADPEHRRVTLGNNF